MNRLYSASSLSFDRDIMTSHKKQGFTPGEGRRFGLLVGGALLVLALVMMLRHRSPVVMTVFSGAGALLVLAGIIMPGRLGPIYRAWMGLALLLSKVTTPILMAVIYFLVIMPIGLLRRAFGRNPLVVRAGSTGYWMSRDPQRRTSMERQF